MSLPDVMKVVTERDLRDPKYGIGDPSEFEFRDDGAIVRKDRWERGIKNIAMSIGTYRDWEVEDVVSKVNSLAYYQAFLRETPAVIDGWPVPDPLRIYVHRVTGNHYRVLGVTNLDADEDRKDKYPVRVIYTRLDDGTIWDRELGRWWIDYEEYVRND